MLLLEPDVVPPGAIVRLVEELHLAVAVEEEAAVLGRDARVVDADRGRLVALRVADDHLLLN